MIPDLAGPRLRAEAAMRDRCLITRNPQGRRNATVDPDTLALDDDVAGPVYEGRCSLNTDTRQTSRTADSLTYRGIIPHGAPMPRAGDTFVVTASEDPALVNRPMTVVDVDARSLVVVRSFSVTMPLPSQAVPAR